jgi:hypothetical protein
VFLVTYELNFCILFVRNSVFKGLHASVSAETWDLSLSEQSSCGIPRDLEPQWLCVVTVAEGFSVPIAN